MHFLLLWHRIMVQESVISLGTRVVLAYVLSAVPAIGVKGIWAAVPIGWILADLTGLIYMRKVTSYTGKGV